MKKPKISPLLVGVISIVAIFGSIFILSLLMSPGNLITQTQQTSFIGEASSQVYSCNWLCNIGKTIRSIAPVQQTVFFSTGEFTSGTLYPKTYNLGDDILLYSRVSCEDYGPYSGGTHNAVMHIFLTNTATGNQGTITLTVPNVANHQYFYAI